ncbi:MAG TPA: class 1 isoprenoid biosynthesis enzyme [Anaerolineae bacterium]|nr:class 1 isoprenoid biosynthesis enzyme [Anaerolineae bacterium]
MYTNELNYIINQANDDIKQNLQQAFPHMAEATIAWLNQLAGSNQAADYFLHPEAYPMFLLPWWADHTINPTPNTALHRTLAYSTMNGYYYIRLIDDIMDNDADSAPHLLPTINFFHTEFYQPYTTLFPANHPFWPLFRQTWFRSGEAAYHDNMLSAITRPQFEQIASKKVCAALIPVAAICHIHQKPTNIPHWSTFIDTLGYWHQMINDIFDWHKDFHHQNVTYFLSHAQQQVPPAQIPLWVSQHGLQWAANLCQQWMSQLQQQATHFDNPDLRNYLQTRHQTFTQRYQTAQSGLTALAKLLTATNPNHNTSPPSSKPAPKS